MFEKRKEAASAEPNVAAKTSKEEPRANLDLMNSRSAAVIGQTIKVKGSITGSENLVVEGTVDGTIDLTNHDLTIGQTGQVDADLNAKTVRVDGQVTGDISGEEKVVVSKSGRVQGNITAPRVTLEDGAKFKGTIDMDPGDNVKAASGPKSVSNKPVEDDKAQAVG